MQPPPAALPRVALPRVALPVQVAAPPDSTYSRRSVGKAASFIPDGAAAPSSSFHDLGKGSGPAAARAYRKLWRRTCAAHGPVANFSRPVCELCEKRYGLTFGCGLRF